nr:hypothetical protein BdHM001_34720 [Bdellovibrio sp. HM001]
MSNKVKKIEWAIDARGNSVHLISPNWSFEQAQEYHDTYVGTNSLTAVTNSEYVAQLEQQLAEAVRIMTEMPESIKAALNKLDQEMEHYSYFGSNPGVSRDDYGDVVNESMAAVNTYLEKINSEKDNECVEDCDEQ